MEEELVEELRVSIGEGGNLEYVSSGSIVTQRKVEAVNVLFALYETRAKRGAICLESP